MSYNIIPTEKFKKEAKIKNTHDKIDKIYKL